MRSRLSGLSGLICLLSTLLIGWFSLGAIPTRFSPMGTGKSGKLWTPMELEPVAWYQGEGNAKDSSGNGYDGTWAGPALYMSGTVGDSLYFNTTNYISVAMSELQQPSNELTVAFWAYFPSIKPTGAGIIGKYLTTYPQGFDILVAGDARVVCCIRGQDALSTLTIPSADMQLGQWMHYVYVHSDITGVGTAYLDGTQITTYSGANDRITRNNAPIIIGNRALLPSLRFLGGVDDVLIFDRALSPAEVKLLYDKTLEQESKPWPKPTN